jgi:hypothetical protein
MKKVRPTSSPESQIDDCVYVVESDECTHVYLSEEEAKADGVESGEFRPLWQVPGPSRSCLWTDDAQTWRRKLSGGPVGELYGIKDEEEHLDLYLDLKDAVQCQPNENRETVEYVVLFGKGFRLSEVESYPEAMLSDAAKEAYEAFLTKQAAELDRSRGRSAPKRKRG